MKNLKISLSQVNLNFKISNYFNKSLKNHLLLKLFPFLAAKGKHDRQILFPALSNINLEIFDGERIGIIGSNGAGKSSLLRILGGVYNIIDGEVDVRGKVDSLLSLNLDISNEITGIESINIYAAMLKIKSSDLNVYRKKVIEFSGLNEFIHYPIRTYSSGMQLRLAFSALTSFSPDILIMDEWLSVADRQFQIKCDKKLKSIIDNSSVLVIASHDFDLLKKITTRILWLDKGKIIMDGNPKNVIDKFIKNSEG